MSESSEPPFPITPSGSSDLVARMDPNMDLVDRARGEGGIEGRSGSLWVPANFVNSLGMEMIWYPPGTFMMGSPEKEEGRRDDEVLHQVTLTRGFWIAATPVTQAHYEAVMGTNPSHFKESGPNAPVEMVRWSEAEEWCRKMSVQDPHYEYRLPTEAEWEYSCRAGTKGAYNVDVAKLDELGWHSGNSGSKPHSVREKRPNAWGLYDCHGNVWEWCADWYQKDLGSQVVTDPQGPQNGGHRVLRGGSWYDVGRHCRSANRYRNDPGTRNNSIGFRPVRIKKAEGTVLEAVAQPEPEAGARVAACLEANGRDHALSIFLHPHHLRRGGRARAQLLFGPVPNVRVEKQFVGDGERSFWAVAAGRKAS